MIKLLIFLSLSLTSVAQAEPMAADTTQIEQQAAPGDSEAPPAAAAQPIDAEPALPSPPTEVPPMPPFSLEGVLPSNPWRGFWPGLGFIFVALAAIGLGQASGFAKRHLADRGLLPRAATWAQLSFRVLSGIAGLGAVIAWLPPSLQPAVPWMLIAAALALGWSVRDLSQDWAGAFSLMVDGRVRPGQWVSTSAGDGIVQSVTLRTTWINDSTGRKISIPNRLFVREAFVTERGKWPTIELQLEIDPSIGPARVRQTIIEAVAANPWSAPDGLDMVKATEHPHMWLLRARLLAGEFSDMFEAALRDHVAERLARPIPGDPALSPTVETP